MAGLRFAATRSAARVPQRRRQCKPDLVALGEDDAGQRSFYF
jgi:hypothetical protein